MVIIRSINEYSSKEKSVVTIGTFDGIHIGHSTICQKTVKLAKKKKHKSVVITFDPHPKQVLQTEIQDKKYLITDLQTKSELLKNNGIDCLVVIPFNEEYSKLSAKEFLQKIIVEKFHPSDIVVGYDHHFGFQRQGNAEFLKQYSKLYNYNFHIVEPVSIDDMIVSSSQIRNYITSKQIEHAKNMLGRPFEISGRVKRGKGRGSILSYPTANIIPLNDNQIIPSNGAYCVTIEFDGRNYKGMCNIGYRPTFENNANTSIIEVNIFSEEEQNIYESDIIVKFHNFVRDEIKFNSSENLIEQLHKDKTFCKKQLIEV